MYILCMIFPAPLRGGVEYWQEHNPHGAACSVIKEELQQVPRGVGNLMQHSAGLPKA